MTEEVIELSINETQALRAKLGLPPLRGQGISSSGSGGGGGGGGQQHGGDKKEELVLSIDETNSLRAKIGLPPLKSSSSSNNNNNNGDGENNKKAGTSSSTAIHVPPPNTYETNQVQKRIEDAAAKRDATDRIKLLERENAKDDNGGRGESALDFAAKMLRGNTDTKQAEGKEVISKKKKKKKKKKMLSNNPQLSLPAHDGEEEDDEEETTNKEYTSADLHGIKVSHDLSEFESGTTTVLTLADKSILNIDTTSTNKVTKLNDNENEMNELINVNMDNDKQSILNLKKKRAIELGAGRAGGYAGYDDDEFDELGGIGITVNGGGGGMINHNGSGGGGGGASSNKKGFEIGKTNINTETQNNKSNNSDLFTSGSINLQSRYTSKVASDFMTSNDIEEEEGESLEMKLEKERKKQAKILNKLRKKKDKKLAKKAKKKRRRRKGSDDDDDDSDDGGIGERVGEGGGDGSLLLANLEATAVGSVKDDNDVRKKKRRRHGEEDDEDDGSGSVNGTKEEGKAGEEDDDNDIMTEKRKRFDMIMEKGKSRTDRAFNRPSMKQLSSRNNDDSYEDADDNDDDDAFLNAALAKARRLKRLKELSGNSNNDTKLGGISGNNVKREDVVVQAVARSKQEEEDKAAAAAAAAREGTTSSATGGKDGGITFEFDEMQEFTRALRAREDQAKRINNSGKGRGVKATVPGSNSSKTKDAVLKSIVKEEETDGPVKVVEDVTMEELAQEMEDNDNNETITDNEEDGTTGGGAFGNTAESAPIGRGMSNFLSMLKHTGEIKNHATKEEMRGRAKDKRTYEDYEQLDLQKVVNVDTHRHNAHEKDIELANREIKLEYRDDFGRLLTRKEAYRDMCYQFHGHGSSKKNQERRLKQIEREREEGTLASRGTAGVGTLGALKATQKATGKAFIIHKT